MDRINIAWLTLTQTYYDAHDDDHDDAHDDNHDDVHDDAHDDDHDDDCDDDNDDNHEQWIHEHRLAQLVAQPYCATSSKKSFDLIFDDAFYWAWFL